MARDREKFSEYQKEYRQRPEVKARQLVENLTPEQLAAKRARYKKWYAANKAKMAVKEKAYRSRPEVRVKIKEAKRKHREKPETKLRMRSYLRAWKHKKVFGIDAEDYERMLKAQKDLCAICRQPEVAQQNGTVKALAVDHDHKTGQVRGLLCQSCNHGIGFLKDNPDTLRRAAAYLLKHKRKVG